MRKWHHDTEPRKTDMIGRVCNFAQNAIRAEEMRMQQELVAPF